MQHDYVIVTEVYTLQRSSLAFESIIWAEESFQNLHKILLNFSLESSVAGSDSMSLLQFESSK